MVLLKVRNFEGIILEYVKVEKKEVGGLVSILYRRWKMDVLVVFDIT